ncbi:hypothetical protein AMS68_003211 [Peltaster fructicola]|uniref:Carboxylic ester hydrolase n=1 Tax=Peltaster fructicola TaxID=286661 RepID=A0A6H0XSI1_9PEZI|nr:hypothetical protein AMS68_003211 [Peltaster fructicola]
MLPFICLTLCVALANAKPWWPFWKHGAEVFVPNVGLVQGSTSKVGDITVSQYLGIPFAQNPPPRFGAPQPARFAGLVNATAYGPTCIQQGNSSTNVVESESCLSLNIVTPPNSHRKSALPVMVWIYGGNLATGGTNISYYNGSSMAANQNVIFVSINYRVNIFGFSGTPDLPLNEVNAGFLDQRLALQWVRDNIEAFGGCPDKVTIFGESAGGFSVEQLVTLPPDPLTFRAAILESRAFQAQGAVNGTTPWAAAVAALGCTGQDELACMRSKDPFEIKAKVARIGFGPVLDNATYTNATTQAIAAGTTAKIPILIGTNANEGTTLALSFTSIPAQIITDYEFTCITGLYSAQLQNASYELWRYYYNASFPNTTPFPGAGAYHGSEIPEVFGTYPTANATQQQVALSKYMQTAWANFAKDPSAGPAQDWPQFGAGGLIQALGANGSYGGSVITAASIEGICTVYDGLIETVGYRRSVV